MIKSPIVPNFFIIGAPKCGTTAMSEYLRSHPQVFMSFPKELNFLADDLPELHAVHSMTDYLNIFRNSTPQHEAIGEASVWHLYSKSALTNIYKLNPAARVIVMLRNPVHFLESYHTHMLYGLVENEESLEIAWSLQKSRDNGQNIPDTCRTPMLLQYDRMARFGKRMEEVLRVFPHDQVKCILFDDFQSDPHAVYLDLLKFLGLKDDGRIDFPQVNVRKTPRSKFIASLMFSPPPLLRSIWQIAKKVFGLKIIHFANWIIQQNSAAVEPNPVPESFKQYLTEILKEDMIKLEKLIDRDLSVWYSKAL